MAIGTHHFPIIFDVAGGGLGDEACSEPSLRYAKKHLYPDADVRIFTRHPELFAHIGWPMGRTVEEINISHTDNYFRIMSSPYQNVQGRHTVHPFASIAQPLFVPTVDYHSLMLLRRILPDADKRIQLVTDAGVEAEFLAHHPEIPKSVLVHIGHTDHTRSLPADYLVELVLALQAQGQLPILFGNPGIEVYPEIPGVKRLRDLTVAETLVAIKYAPLLITNDSAPVHLASAWDNAMIVLPTIRHPDRLVHPRWGHRYFKCQALYQKLMVDDRNYAPHELIQEWEWTPVIEDKREYLPRIESVIATAGEFLV